MIFHPKLLFILNAFHIGWLSSVNGTTMSSDGPPKPPAGPPPPISGMPMLPTPSLPPPPPPSAMSGTFPIHPPPPALQPASKPPVVPPPVVGVVDELKKTTLAQDTAPALAEPASNDVKSSTTTGDQTAVLDVAKQNATSDKVTPTVMPSDAPVTAVATANVSISTVQPAVLLDISPIAQSIEINATIQRADGVVHLAPVAKDADVSAVDEGQYVRTPMKEVGAQDLVSSKSGSVEEEKAAQPHDTTESTTETVKKEIFQSNEVLAAATASVEAAPSLDSSKPATATAAQEKAAPLHEATTPLTASVSVEKEPAQSHETTKPTTASVEEDKAAPSLDSSKPATATAAQKNAVPLHETTTPLTASVSGEKEPAQLHETTKPTTASVEEDKAATPSAEQEPVRLRKATTPTTASVEKENAAHSPDSTKAAAATAEEEKAAQPLEPTPPVVASAEKEPAQSHETTKPATASVEKEEEAQQPDETAKPATASIKEKASRSPDDTATAGFANTTADLPDNNIAANCLDHPARLPIANDAGKVFEQVGHVGESAEAVATFARLQHDESRPTASGEGTVATQVTDGSIQGKPLGEDTAQLSSNNFSGKNSANPEELAAAAPGNQGTPPAESAASTSQLKDEKVGAPSVSNHNDGLNTPGQAKALPDFVNGKVAVEQPRGADDGTSGYLAAANKTMSAGSNRQEAATPVYKAEGVSTVAAVSARFGATARADPVSKVPGKVVVPWKKPEPIAKPASTTAGTASVSSATAPGKFAPWQTKLRSQAEAVPEKKEEKPVPAWKLKQLKPVSAATSTPSNADDLQSKEADVVVREVHAPSSIAPDEEKVAVKQPADDANGNLPCTVSDEVKESAACVPELTVALEETQASVLAPPQPETADVEAMAPSPTKQVCSTNGGEAEREAVESECKDVKSQALPEAFNVPTPRTELALEIPEKKDLKPIVSPAVENSPLRRRLVTESIKSSVSIAPELPNLPTQPSPSNAKSMTTTAIIDIGFKPAKHSRLDLPEDAKLLIANEPQVDHHVESTVASESPFSSSSPSKLKQMYAKLASSPLSKKLQTMSSAHASDAPSGPRSPVQLKQVTDAPVYSSVNNLVELAELHLQMQIQLRDFREATSRNQGTSSPGMQQSPAPSHRIKELLEVLRAEIDTVKASMVPAQTAITTLTRTEATADLDVALRDEILQLASMHKGTAGHSASARTRVAEPSTVTLPTPVLLGAESKRPPSPPSRGEQSGQDHEGRREEKRGEEKKGEDKGGAALSPTRYIVSPKQAKVIVSPR